MPTFFFNEETAEAGKIFILACGPRGLAVQTGAIEEKAREIAERVARGAGAELVAVVYVHEMGRWVLRVFVDMPGGVTLDDCANISRELGAVLDVEDVIPQSYVLEVSSPGLMRPLMCEKDFRGAIGKKVHLKTRSPIDGRRNFRAVVEGLEDREVSIRDSEGRVFRIPLENIEKAALVF
jgi:ribosome maturation factor RimP